MPFTPEMRRKVDQIRDYLYGGGYPDPLSNAEQLSFLFFFYMVEGIDAANLRQAKATRRDYASLFAGDFSGMIPEPAGTTPLATDPLYAQLFAWLGGGSVAVGVLLVVLVPFLRRLIKDRDASTGDAPAAAVEGEAEKTP